MKVLDTVAVFYRSETSAVIYWEPNPATSADAVVNVGVSEGPEGPFVEIGPAIASDRFIVYTHDHLARWRRVTFQVVCGRQTEVINLGTVQHPVARYIHYNMLPILQSVGRLVALYVPTLRQPCTYCRDSVTNEITNSQCAYCSGTGYYQGYHSGILTLAMTAPVEESQKVGPTGYTELHNKTWILPPVPVLPVHSILRDLRSGMAYKVIRIIPSEMRDGSRTNQQVQCLAESPASVIHSLAIPTNPIIELRAPALISFLEELRAAGNA